MSTALEAAGRPIGSCAGGDRGNGVNYNSVESNCVSATSTVVLDPAAFLENWKKQIQGKHSIPVHQQRLTFASNHYPYPGINLFSWSCATQEQSENGPVSRDLVTCLQSWQAILRSEKCNIAKLLNPEIFTESDKLPSDLKSKTAEEIRDLGIPCSVYYLSFSKCILAAQSQRCQEAADNCKNITNLCIKVDQEFQLKEFEVDLYGRLSKSSHPLHFSYRFNGRYIVAHLSMLEQTVQYRQGHKMRQSLVKRNNSGDELADGSSTEPVLDTNGTSTLVKPLSGQNYYVPGSKDQEITTRISSESEMRCIVLTVIILNIPLERMPHALVHPVNDVKETKTSTPDSSLRIQKHIRKEAGRTQQWNSKCLLNSTTMNHVSDPKAPDSAKQKRVVGAKARKSKGGCILESQPSKSAEDDSFSNVQTDSSNGCSSSRPSDSSKADDTSKKAVKKKRRKNKRNTKNNGTDTPIALKEKSQECNLASGKNVTSTSGKVHIPFSGSSKGGCNKCDYINSCETNIFKNNIDSPGNPEMRTAQMGEGIDSNCPCSKGLSNQRSFLSQETCASETLKSGNYDHGNQTSVEVLLTNTQNVTSNLLTDESTHQLFENRTINSPSTEATDSPSILGSISCCNLMGHQTDQLSAHDEKTSAFESYNEGKGSVLHCDYSGMDSKVSVSVPCGCKCAVLKCRVSDFHRISNGTCSDVIISNSNFQAGSSNGNLHSVSGVYNNDTGNRNEMMDACSHDNNKHIAQVGRAREIQFTDRKMRVAGGKKLAGTSCGLSSSASGNTNSSGIGNVHNKIGKENNHVVWQKVQKFTVDDNICECGTNDFMQSQSVLDSQNALPEVNTNSEKNTPTQILPPSSQKYRDNESKHSQQKLRCTDIYLEQRDSQNDTVFSDAQCRFRVQEDSLRSQQGRVDKSLCNTDRLTVVSTHTTATNISKAFEQKKTGRSRSDRSGQYLVKGFKDFAVQKKHSKSFPAHQNAEMHDTDQANKYKSSSLSSASHQANQMLPLSRILNSVGNELLPTNNQVNEASKTTDTSMMVSSEKDLKKHTISQEVPVKIKSSGMVKVSIPETAGVDSHLMDVENNSHEGSSNHELYSSVTRSKSSFPAQTNAMGKEHTCEVSCKWSSSPRTSTSLSNLHLPKMAHVISDSIFASYQSQLASESIACVIGSPLAEFEKVLYSVSPLIESVPRSDKCSNYSGKLGITSLVCRCQIADIPLKNIWHWFEKPCNYGLEVKAEDIRLSERFNVDGNLFRAYFVPFLSGIQLFGFSGRQSCRQPAVRVKRQEDTDEIRNFEDSYHSHFEHLPILSSLLPKPFVAEKTGGPRFSQSIDTFSSGNQSCNMLPEFCNYAEMEILFEYFESEQPQQRRPLLSKIKELIKSGAGSSCQAFGDRHILESIKFGDLHPASWFSVAWYPIYRIPEGQFHAAFLTYHSLGHFVHRDVSSITLHGHTDSCIAAPVVGLQNYNAQGECWFVPNKQCEPFSNENVSSNPLDVLQDRMTTLEETASLLARGCAKNDTSYISSKQSDYEFFLSRRRRSLIR